PCSSFLFLGTAPTASYTLSLHDALPISLHDAGPDLLHLLRRQLEHQLVVDLQHHVHVRVLGAEPLVQGDHGPLDDVGRGPLHGRIDGGALGVLAALAVAGVDLRQVQAAAEDRLDIALAAGLLADPVHVGLDPRIALEVAIDVALRLLAVDPDLARQAKGRHAVDQ